MPLYEYYCPTCDEKFEALRPLSRRDDPAACSRGHRGERMLSLFATYSRGENGETSAVGGDCLNCAGGSCACAGH